MGTGKLLNRRILTIFGVHDLQPCVAQIHQIRILDIGF